jgi:hypothetical protein
MYSLKGPPAFKIGYIWMIECAVTSSSVVIVRDKTICGLVSNAVGSVRL